MTDTNIKQKDKELNNIEKNKEESSKSERSINIGQSENKKKA